MTNSNDTHSTAERASILARRLTLALIGVVVGLAVVLILFEYVRGRHQLLRDAQGELNARVRLVAERTDAALRERQRIADLWPQLDAAQDIAVDDVDQRLTESLSHLAASLGPGTIALATDTTGRVIAASQQRLIGRPAPADSTSVWLFTKARVISRADQRPLGTIVIMTAWQRLIEAAAGPYARAAFVASGGRSVYGKSPARNDLTASRRIRSAANLDLAVTVAESRAAALAPLWRTQRQLLLFVLLLVLVAAPAMLAIARANAVILAQQERLAAVGMMAASLAHEIRTPLSILRTSADVLMRSPDHSERDKEVVSFILDETERLEKLVNDLLTFARPRTPVLQPTDLADIARRAVRALEAQARPAEVGFRSALASAPVHADADQLYQVALNLCTNALHASPRGGDIDIVTGVNGSRAFLQVHDRGSGMDAVTVEKIWTPFFSQRAGGTGLGLAIVKRIVDDHRGRITVVSRVAAGTRMTVELPAKGASA